MGLVILNILGLLQTCLAGSGAAALPATLHLASSRTFCTACFNMLAPYIGYLAAAHNKTSLFQSAHLFHVLSKYVNASCQAVVVTDPVLATAVLRSKNLDKLRFQYSFLDPVCGSVRPLHTICIGVKVGSWRACSTQRLLQECHSNAACCDGGQHM